MKFTQKPWATPLLKHQESVVGVFDTKNDNFYYVVYKIKLIVIIQGNT